MSSPRPNTTTPSATLPPRLESLEQREVPAVVGALDPSFGTGGKVSVDLGATEYLRAVALQDDGKIVGVGQTNAGGTSDFLVVRFNPDGTRDMAFNGGTGKQVIDFGGADTATAVLVQPDGKVVVAGEGAPAPADFCVARLNPDGTYDTSFSGDGKETYVLGGTDHAEALGLQSDGTIIVAGHSDKNSATTGPNDFAVIRVNGATGAQVGATKFIDFANGDDQVVAGEVAVYTSGPRKDQFIVVGQGGAAPLDFALARLAADMSTVETHEFSQGNVDIATDVAIQPDGKVLVGGYTNAAGTNDFAATRVLDNLTTLDTTFNPTGAVTGVPGRIRLDLGGSDISNDLLLQPDGKFVITGVSNAKGAQQMAAARFNADGSLDTTFNAGGGADAGKAFVGITGSDDARGAVLDPNGRIVLAGDGNFANIALARLIGTVEKGQRLAVGGGTDGQARVFTPAFATGQYGSMPASTPASVFPGFAGAVRTAVGDVNGDGVPDVALITGPGTPTRFAVLSGADNATPLIAPMAPFAGSEDFAGGGFVAVGDLDHDGRAEVVVTPDEGGGPRVTVFSLRPDNTVATRANFFGIDDPNFRGGCRAALGDVNGDGTPDLAVAAGFLGGPRVALFDGKTVLGTPTRLVGDFFAFPGEDATRLRNGAYVAAGDVDGDGKADLIFGGGPGGAPRVFVLSGALVAANNVTGAQTTPIANFFVANNSTDRGGVRVAAADADGDNKAEVVAGSGEGSAARARVYLGKSFTAATEPAAFQDLDPYGSAVLAGGVFVG